MAFLNQFASYFSQEDRETELYNLWSAIGVNMEKAFLEEQNKINAEFTDINNFSEDTMRSWLAFFLQKIPYRTTATTQVTVSLDGNYEKTEINKYDKLTTGNGVIYTLLENITLIGDDKRTVTAAQGNRIVETGIYHDIIKVQANNPDLSYLSVYINGNEIPEVSYETSYDQLSFLGSWKPSSDEHPWGGSPFLQDAYGRKGNAYFVIAKGSTKFAEDGILHEFNDGDILVYDGEHWQKSAYTNKLTPIQFADTFAVPRNGYFAYFYNNYLYIKIFTGSSISDPEGQNYEISYLQSDGIQGMIGANTLQFVSDYEDINENKVTLSVTNTASTPAVNQPSTGKLGLYLKQRFYSSINVSSVPEYTAWFNAQPEVGDCLVLSDYEKHVRSGKNLESYENTGIVTVYLVDPNGKELTPETAEILLDRIAPYKDIAVLEIQNFVRIENHIEFVYTTTTNENAFEQFVKSKAGQYYNLSYLQSKESSLFDELDLAAMLKDILDTSPYNSTGLIVRGYHYRSEEITNSRLLTFDSYQDERPGIGWYVLTTNTGEVYNLEEVEVAGSTTSCTIHDKNDPSVIIGTHIDNVVSIDLNNYQFESATLECYWGMANEGILSIGKDNGLRSLHSVTVTKVRQYDGGN